MFTEVLHDARSSLKWRLPVLVVLMCAASLLEGAGLTMLLPLLATLGVGDESQSTPLMEWVETVLQTLGIPLDLGPLMIVVIGLLVLQVVVTFARKVFETLCTTRYTAEWRSRLFRAVIEADWPYLMRSRASQQANTIVNEASRVSAALSLSLQMVNAGFLIAVYAIVSLVAAWQMVVFLVVFGVAIYFVTRPLSKRGQVVGQEVTVVSEGLMHHTHEFLANAKLIKSTATENTASTMIETSIERYRKTYVTAGILPSLVMLLYMGFGYIVLGIGVWAALTRASIAPVAVIVSIYVFLRQAFELSAPALPSIRGVLAQAQAAREHSDGGSRLTGEGPAEVVVEGLTVDYAGRDALIDVSATLPAGRIVGVTGASGAGKSTFIDAILGLVSASQVRVLVDNTSIETLDLRDLRAQIGCVAQETLLFQGTVTENIAWAQPAATPDEIEEAARLAGAHQFITAMPQKYATKVGGRGVSMSGGQRQRIGLARALLGKKRLLVLDEATSALDSDSEGQVLAAIAALKGRVTIVLVAHRLSTLKIADEIMVFESGRIVETGPVQELSSGQGRFGQLLAMQSIDVVRQNESR